MYYPVDICDAHFDLQRLHLCTLLIDADRHRFSYAVLDQRNGQIVLLKEIVSAPTIPFDFNELIKLTGEDAVLSARFSKIIFSSVVSKYSLVPSAFYDDSKTEELFLFNNTLEENETLKTFPVKMPASQLVYVADGAWSEITQRKFSNARQVPQIAVLVQLCMQRFRYKQHPVITLHVRNGAFEMVIVSESKLQLCNTFKYQNSEDFIYYVLFACEQLSINPATVELHLSGEANDQTAEVVMLRKYMNNVTYLSRTLNHGFAREFESIEAHHFTTLFDLSLCE